MDARLLSAVARVMRGVRNSDSCEQGDTQDVDPANGRPSRTPARVCTSRGSVVVVSIVVVVSSLTARAAILTSHVLPNRRKALARQCVGQYIGAVLSRRLSARSAPNPRGGSSNEISGRRLRELARGSSASHLRDHSIRSLKYLLRNRPPGSLCSRYAKNCFQSSPRVW